MDAATAAREAAPAISALGALRFGLHEELAELNDRHRWHRVYFAGRAAPVAHSPRLAEALLWFFPSHAVQSSLTRVAEKQDLGEFTADYLEAVAAVGDRVFADTPDAAELAELMQRLVDAIDHRGAPMAAAWHDVPTPATTGATIEHLSMILREFRFDQHVHVLVSHGLQSVEAIALTALWKDRDPQGQAEFFGWREAEDLGEAMRRLEVSGRVDDQGKLTDRGREERDAMENLTNALASQPWFALDSDERGRLVALLRSAADATKG